MTFMIHADGLLQFRRNYMKIWVGPLDLCARICRQDNTFKPATLMRGHIVRPAGTSLPCHSQASYDLTLSIPYFTIWKDFSLVKHFGLLNQQFPPLLLINNWMIYIYIFVVCQSVSMARALVEIIIN